MVSVYRRVEAYYAQASSTTAVGIWVASGDVDVIPTSTPDVELGTALARRLEHSLRGVAHPNDWKSVTVPLLKASKMRSYNAFARDAELVSIEERDGPVTITPMKRVGPRSGYEPQVDRAVTIASVALERLGTVVRELLASRP
jgi:hypothetical protein